MIKLDYIQVPVLAQFRFPTSRQRGAVLIAGPSIGFKASCKVKADAGTISAEFDCDDPDEDFIPLKSTDLNGVLGVGVESRNHHLRAAHPRLQQRQRPGRRSGEVRNRVFSLAVGFGFSRADGWRRPALLSRRAGPRQQLSQRCSS
ncbi:MAG: hypothetical protein R2909_14980 [Gemmatimonadales bacterium]